MNTPAPYDRRTQRPHAVRIGARPTGGRTIRTWRTRSALTWQWAVAVVTAAIADTDSDDPEVAQ
jgi:hypothetical protein